MLEEYGHVLEWLYRAIQSVRGVRVGTNSSKRLAYAFVLYVLLFATLCVIHLVRDKRTVAYSWSKEKARPKVVAYQVTLTPQRSPAKVSRVSNLGKYSFRFLSRFSNTRLPNEGFDDDPASYVCISPNRLGVDRKAGNLRFLDHRGLSLAVDHTVSGNPSRFRHGPLELRLDEAWKDKVGVADRRIISALTAPLLIEYGYPGSRKKAK